VEDGAEPGHPNIRDSALLVGSVVSGGTPSWSRLRPGGRIKLPTARFTWAMICKPCRRSRSRMCDAVLAPAVHGKGFGQ